MYIPAHFAPDEALVGELLQHHGAADLVTVTAEGLVATMLPFIHVPGWRARALREHGALHGHVARNNDQWKLPAQGESLAIVRGPDAYISPVVVRLQGRARAGRADLELRHGARLRRSWSCTTTRRGRRTWFGGSQPSMRQTARIRGR